MPRPPRCASCAPAWRPLTKPSTTRAAAPSQCGGTSRPRTGRPARCSSGRTTWNTDSLRHHRHRLVKITKSESHRAECTPTAQFRRAQNRWKLAQPGIPWTGAPDDLSEDALEEVIGDGTGYLDGA